MPRHAIQTTANTHVDEINIVFMLCNAEENLY